jgi:hypothetical protein
MKNNGLLFKPFKDGFRILYESKLGDVYNDRNNITNSETILRFHVKLNDSDFYSYTSDFSKDINVNCCYFHNIVDITPSPFSNSHLHAEEFISEKDVVNYTTLLEMQHPKPFGVLDVKLYENLPKEFSINFSEKKTIWRYIIVSEHLKSLNNPAILSNSTVFVGPKTILLPNNQEAISFESPEEFGVLQTNKTAFQLVEDYDTETLSYKIVLKVLPNPDVKKISLIASKNNPQKTYSEIFIY